MKIYDLFPELDLEDYNVEFKGRLDEKKPIGWVKTIAAFANGKGGTLFIGVENKSRVIVSMTAQEADHQSLVFHNFVTNLIEPYIETEIQTIPIGEEGEKRYLLKVSVKPSQNLPVLAKNEGDRVVYVRDFGLTRSANPSELINLVTRNPSVSYDEMPTDVPYRDKDFTDLFAEYADRHQKPLNEKILSAKKFFSKDGKLTRGGLLFRDDNEDPITLLTICRYPGISKGGDEILNRQNINGPITRNIRQAVSAILEMTGEGIRKTNEGEEDFVCYPRRALVEGIANAYAHRNYFRSGAKIQVDIFVDRLEITSPGSMVGGANFVHEKNLSAIIPDHRNAFIVRVLTLVGLTQAEGTGFDKISELYLPYDEPYKPFLDSNEESTTLVLPNTQYAKGVVGEDNLFPDVFIEGGEDLDAKSRKILSFCYLKPRTVKEIADALGVSVSSYLRDQVVRRLIQQGFLLLTNASPLSVASDRTKVRIV